MPVAHATFTLDRFDADDPYEQLDGVDYARAHIHKTFQGDFEGTSEVAMLSVQGPDGRGYVALETLRGALSGREGTFALLHLGTQEGAGYSAHWPIAPGSGTGGLRGIAGDAQIVIEPDGSHRLELSYSFPDA